MTKKEIEVLKGFRKIRRETWPRPNWIYEDGSPYVWARYNVFSKTWNLCFFQNRDFQSLQEAVDEIERIAVKAPSDAKRVSLSGFRLEKDGHVVSLSFAGNGKWYARYEENSMLHSEWVEDPSEAVASLPAFSKGEYKPVRFFEYKDDEGFVDLM